MAKINGKAMECGGCGCATVELFATHAGDDRLKLTSITARCTECKSTTVFGVPAPVIVGEWGKDSKGLHCIGYGK